MNLPLALGARRLLLGPARPGRRAAGLLALAIGAALLGVAVGNASRGHVGFPQSEAIEQQWGIRVSNLAVTADGGLVEVRFLVLDGDRALAMMGSARNIPVLRVEATGNVVVSAAMMSSHKAVSPGRSSFLLYRNTRGAIKPGSLVTLDFGGLRLEHVLAE